MRLYLLAAVCAAASSTASAELLTFNEWTVEDDGRKCVMTYEDTDRMIDIIAEKGGFAQFATDPSTTLDTDPIPRVPMMIWSQPFSLAYRVMTSAGSPTPMLY